MTATTTPRDFRSPTPGAVPGVNSPGASTGARANIPVTDGDGNSKTTRLSFGSWLGRQWAWTARPDSYAGTWAASRVDPRRIPGNARPLRLAWLLSNLADRPLMFALILISPTGLTGPLRWIAQRPARRWGLYLTLAALGAALLIGRT